MQGLLSPCLQELGSMKDSWAFGQVQKQQRTWPEKIWGGEGELEGKRIGRMVGQHICEREVHCGL